MGTAFSRPRRGGSRAPVHNVRVPPTRPHMIRLDLGLEMATPSGAGGERSYASVLSSYRPDAGGPDLHARQAIPCSAIRQSAQRQVPRPPRQAKSKTQTRQPGSEQRHASWFRGLVSYKDRSAIRRRNRTVKERNQVRRQRKIGADILHRKYVRLGRIR